MPNNKIKPPNLRIQNGKFTFTATLGTDPTTGKRIQKRRGGFKTEKEALEAYLKLKYEWGESKGSINEPSKDSDITFKKFVDDWFIPNYRNRVAEQTFETRNSIIKNYYNEFHQTPLTEIKKRDISRWHDNLIDQRRREGKTSHNHIRTVKQLLSMIFEYAIELEFCTNNPAKEVKSRKRDETEIQFWTMQEFEKVCNTFYIHDYYQHFGFTSLNFLFMTGLRIGEATALTWEDIDLEDGIVNVTKTLIYKNMHDFHFGKPKTKSSIRKVALDQETIQLLKNWKAHQERTINTQYILSYNGIPTNKYTLRHIIRRHSKLANVKEIKIHALRHSHASMLINLGEDPVILKERLGHKDIQVTLGTYSHLYPNRDFELVSRLNGKIKKSFSKIDLICNQGNQYLQLDSHPPKIDGDTR